MHLDDDRTPLERLYERLTDALNQRSDPYGAPVTVAEIYQELVPYRMVRTDVGFALNADYEHALLRLLSGEGSWARLEPTSARDVIMRELSSPNPNVSVYREYAGCDVWITPRTSDSGSSSHESGFDDGADLPWLGLDDEETDPSAFSLMELTDDEIEEEQAAPGTQWQNGGPVGADAANGQQAGSGDERQDGSGAEWQHGPDPVSQDSARQDAAAAAPGGASADRQRSASAGAQGSQAGREPSGEDAREADMSSAGAGETGAGRRSTAQAAAEQYAAARQSAAREAVATAPCVFCDSALPQGRKVRFCPFCGGDQTMRPCGECGDAMEPGWLFCVGCGAPSQSTG
ncbi:hypothetical protein BH23GEM9_BH23GEM9_01590 [soil metagenome]